MKKQKLVYAVRRATGGMQNHLLDLALELKRHYDISVIFHPNKTIENLLKSNNIDFFQVEINPKLNPAKDIKSIVILTRILNQLAPDILHIHGNKSSFVYRIAAKFANVKKVIVTVHNFMKWQNAGFIRRMSSSFVERYLAKSTFKIITVSHALKRNLVEIEKIPQEKIVVIPNYYKRRVVKNKAFIRSKLHLNDDIKLVLNVGRLVKDKDQLTLIRAMTYFDSNIKLVIAGEGRLRPVLEKEIVNLDLDNRVFLLGHRDDVLSLMHEADLFVLSSIKEGMPLTLFEAMMTGLAIVATTVGGIPEVVENGKSAVLVPPKNPEILASAIQKTVLDEQLKISLIEQAKERLKMYSFSNAITKVRRIYEEAQATS